MKTTIFKVFTRKMEQSQHSTGPSSDSQSGASCIPSSVSCTSLKSASYSKITPSQMHSPLGMGTKLKESQSHPSQKLKKERAPETLKTTSCPGRTQGEQSIKATQPKRRRRNGAEDAKKGEEEEEGATSSAFPPSKFKQEVCLWK